MDFDWVGIEKLSISEELKRAGYRRPTGADVDRVSEIGPIFPCVVREDSIPGTFQILANAYIWLAVQQAGQYEVPVSIVSPADQTECDVIVKSDAGESPIERAGRYRSWLKVNPESTVADLARIENCNRTSIAHSVRLLKLAPEIQSLIDEGSISAAHGIELLKIKNAQRQLELAKKTASLGWSVRELKNKISNKKKSMPGDVEKNPDLVREEKLLKQSIGSPVTIDEEQGLVIIDYRKNLDVYEGIRQKLLS